MNNTKENNMYKIRTINGASLAVKELDPQTAITPTALRRLVITGKIKSVQVRAKYLICLADVFDFFIPKNK